MYTADRVVSLVDECGLDPGELHVMWVHWSEGGRAEAAKSIESARGRRFIVPIVVRDLLFLTANAVLADVIRVVSDNRGAFEGAQSSGCVPPIVVMLLGKEEFRHPLISSPVDLPLWFPIFAGRTVYSQIRDLGQTADIVLLNAPEANVEVMSAALWELEEALVTRFEHSDPTVVERILVRAFKGDRLPRLVGELLAEQRTHVNAVTEPRGYRVSLKDERSLASLLLRTLLKTKPDEWGVLARDLGQALRLNHTVPVRSTLASVLFRPVATPTPNDRFAHHLLLTMYGSYQFITGAAHAGDYPRLPARLIAAVAQDLSRGLREALALLRET